MEKSITKLDVKQKLEYYYELDLYNCIMTHKEWIVGLTEDLTNKNCFKNFFNENEKLLSRKEASQFLISSLLTLWRCTESGDLKNLKIGNRVYFIYSDIIKSLNKKGGSDEHPRK